MTIILEFDPFRNIYVLYWLIALLIGLVAWIARILKERAGQSWPVVNGTVESGEVIANGNNGYRVEVRYSYSVNREYYSGLFFRLAPTEKKGDKILAQFPKDLNILVHYKADNPETSVLDHAEIKARSELPIPTG